MRQVWILWTAPACGGRGTGEAVPVEVCRHERQAQLGGPHHGYQLACYRHAVRDDGTVGAGVWCWDTDAQGVPPGHGSWRAKVGEAQVKFLIGCLRFGGWHRVCGWRLHRNVAHDERTAKRLADRGLLLAEPRIVQGQRVTLYTVADAELAQRIIDADGVIPDDALASGEVVL